MPTYEYECEACHRVFEVRQRITEDPLTTCEACGGHVRRLLSPAPFILKGEGWYVTDYPSESRKKAMQSEKSSSSTASSESASKPDGAKSDGAKSDGGSTSSSTASDASSSASSKSD
ncbi:MAG TPA: FmdB family zinc ribbon protein [Methylomirabilota bacterium]|jgi:putative FmdB family regulatory protein|nr:FmdB family zinc ribbon protein [Methylomirabilota bacterium]